MGSTTRLLCSWDAEEQAIAILLDFGQRLFGHTSKWPFDMSIISVSSPNSCPWCKQKQVTSARFVNTYPSQHFASKNLATLDKLLVLNIEMLRNSPNQRPWEWRVVRVRQVLVTHSVSRTHCFLVHQTHPTVLRSTSESEQRRDRGQI